MDESVENCKRRNKGKFSPNGRKDGPCAYCAYRDADPDSCSAFFSEDRFLCLSDVAFEGIIIHDKGKLVYVNQQMADMFGYDLEEIFDMDLQKLFAPESRDRIRQNIRDESLRPYEAIGQKKTGGRFPLEIRVRQIQMDGRMVRLAAIRDLTLQKQHEQQIQAIFESSTDQIIVCDLNYTHLYINQVALDFAGIKRENVIGKTVREALGHMPEYRDMWITRIDEILKTGRPEQFEDQVRGPDCVDIFMQSVLFPIRYPEGEIFAVGVISRDITEQKQLQQQLEESEQKYRQLYIESPISLFRTRISDGKILECSRAHAYLMGYDSREEFLEKGFSTDHYANPKRRQELIKRLNKEKRVDGFPLEILRRDGTAIWVEISAEIFPEKGYIEGSHRDITALRLLTKAEKKVLGLIHEGMSNKEIAFRLNKSVRTIEDHRRNLMRKLSVDNIVDLINQTQSFVAEQENENNG